jgi:hypothetical protein
VEGPGWPLVGCDQVVEDSETEELLVDQVVGATDGEVDVG